jgi:H+-transporting ATPase
MFWYESFAYVVLLWFSEAEELLKQYGRNELVEKKVPSWRVFLKQLYQPMPIMIWIAIIIEAAIQNWLDMGILLAIQVGSCFEAVT